MKIESMTDGQLKEMEAFRAKQLADGHSLRALDMQEVKTSVDWMYSKLGKEPPTIIRCQSPWQMSYMPAVMKRLGSGTEIKMDADFKKDAQDAFNSRFWASWWWTGWYAFLDFPRKLGIEYPAEKNQDLDSVIASLKAAFGYTMYDKICFVCERPVSLTVDTAQRHHNETGPALRFSDGYSLYSWHGLTLPEGKEWIITNPEQITIEKIDAEENQEIKRVMLERFGIERYLKEGNAVKVHQDETGTLYRKPIPGTELTLTMVHVINGSLEPDGTRREFFLEVHEELRPMHKLEDGTINLGEPQEPTARNAVASTYGLRGEAYELVMRT